MKRILFDSLKKRRNVFDEGQSAKNDQPNRYHLLHGALFKIDRTNHDHGSWHGHEYEQYYDNRHRTKHECA